MAIRVFWDDQDKTVLRYEFSGLWTWDEFHAAMRQGWAMLDSVQHPVDVINDFSVCDFVPPNSLSHFVRAARRTHPNSRHIVVVGVHNPFLRAIGTILGRMFPEMAQKMSYADSLEEARAMLNQRLPII
jgi:hypothetical protein